MAEGDFMPQWLMDFIRLDKTGEPALCEQCGEMYLKRENELCPYCEAKQSADGG